MSEISCTNCRAACCKGPLIIELGPQELESMVEAGTTLYTIASPAPYDREEIAYPAVITDMGEDQPPEIQGVKGAEFQPLAAGIGRYIMMGTCGFLKTSKKGWEYCGAYQERPAVCRDFEEGGDKCSKLRQLQGVDPMSEELLQVQEMLRGQG